MRPDRLLAACLLVVASSCWPSPSRAQQPPTPGVATTEPRTPAEELASFRLPPGFAIELVAAEPAIHKPMNLAFDDRGRLWVTSTVEYPYPAKEGTTPRDRVIVLADFADDGHARSTRTFADGLNIPIGVLPIGRGDSALVHSIPSIRRHTDTDGDGKADKVEVAYEQYGFRDTHGMTNAFSWGFDGWIYACHGFSNDSTVQGSDKTPLEMSSGNIYRMKPDGSRVEIYSRGQVNPFGLAFDPLGHLYSCDCHSKPIYQNLRGAFYPSFGKPDDGLGFGPEMIGHDHGSTGIGGISIYEADHFPPEYSGTIFLGNVVTGRINHDRIEWHGSSPEGDRAARLPRQRRPLVPPGRHRARPRRGALHRRLLQPDHRPLRGPPRPPRPRPRARADLADRLQGQGRQEPAARHPRPDGPPPTVAELVSDLGHSNMVVRTSATNQLVALGEPAVAALGPIAASDAPAPARVHALWALHRLGKLAPGDLARASTAADEAVRVHAMAILADTPRLEPADGGRTLAGLKDASPHVRRAAASAVGRHPAPDHVPPLIALVRASEGDDTHLKHVARIALRDQLTPASTWDKLAAMALSEADERTLADVAPGVPSADAARWLLGYLQRRAEPLPTRIRFAHHVARYGDARPRSRAGRLRPPRRVPPDGPVWSPQGDGAGRAGARGLARPAMPGGWPPSRPGASWPRRRTTSSGPGSSWSASSGSARRPTASSPSPPTGPLAPPRRLAAMKAMAEVAPDRATAPLALVVRDPAAPFAIREQAANLLATSGRPEGREALVDALATAPAQLQTTIASALAQGRDGAEALLDAVTAGKASARPLGERGVVVRLEASGVPDLKARLDSLLKDLPPADVRVVQLIDARKAGYLASGGSAAAGSAVFAKNCAACHQIEGQGARVGPQLDGVGLRGLDRLLEDVLDPNRNVDQAFRTTTIALNDGRVASGLLLRQDGEILVLADAKGQEVRVAAAFDRGPQALACSRRCRPTWPTRSPEADFRDLMAFLLSKKPAGTASPARP